LRSSSLWSLFNQLWLLTRKGYLHRPWILLLKPDLVLNLLVYVETAVVVQPALGKSTSRRRGQVGFPHHFVDVAHILKVYAATPIHVAKLGIHAVDTDVAIYLQLYVAAIRAAVNRGESVEPA
jgi:hypothetical protein